MDVTPVTNEQFTRFVGDSKHVTTAEAKKREATWRSSHFGVVPDPQFPVCEVSWFDAEAYGAWIGGPVRLPTEAEFERVLRGGKDGTLYPWGEAWPPPEGWGVKNGESTRRVVTETEPKHFGLRDLVGNVKTWCSIGFMSERKPFPGPASIDDVNVDPALDDEFGVFRALRGASWYWSSGAYRCSHRGLVEPEFASFHSGFRLVAPVPRPVSDLVRDLTSSDAGLRRSAIVALGRSGTRDPAAIRALVLAQADEDFRIGDVATGALDVLSPPSDIALSVLLPAQYEERAETIEKPARLEWQDESHSCAYGPALLGERQGDSWVLVLVPPVVRLGGSRTVLRTGARRAWRMAVDSAPPPRAGTVVDEDSLPEAEGLAAPPAPAGRHAGPVPPTRAGQGWTEFWIPERGPEPGRWIWRRTFVCLAPGTGRDASMMVPNTAIRLDVPTIEGTGDSALIRFHATVTGQKGPAATALRVTFKLPGATDLAVNSGTMTVTMSTKAGVATSSEFALAEGQSVSFGGTARLGDGALPDGATVTVEVFDGDAPIAQATKAVPR
jgi:hypothetical protein